MTGSLKTQFLARDAYRAWKHQVEAARTSTRVVTPYFDAMLLRLLKNSTLESEQLQVLTDLSPESGTLSYRRQLLATRALLLSGIEVRSLPRVHAKVLVCDNNVAVVGSQNFTTYARSSRETTVLPALALSGSTFLRTIEGWWSSAMTVDRDFIEMLLEQLDDSIRAAEAANQALTIQFDQLLEEEQERLVKIEQRRNHPIKLDIENALRSDRVARGIAHTRLKYVEWYESLSVLDPTATLARWIVGTKTEPRIVRLVPTLFYPILLNPSGRVGFARVAKTRITYVRTGGRWNSPEAFGSISYRMSVTMPETNLEDHNVRVVLSPVISVPRLSIELHLRFVGDSAELIRAKAIGEQTALVWGSGRRERRDLDDLCSEVTAPAVVSQIIRAALKGGFAFERLGVDNHNADVFFPRGLLAIRLIEYGPQPILVASSI